MLLSHQPHAATLPTRTSAPGTSLLFPMLVAVFAVSFPVFVHITSPTAAILACVATAMLIVAFADEFIPFILIVGFLFQNFCVAIVSPMVPDEQTFNAIRAYNFLNTAVTWLLIMGTYFTTPRPIRNPLSPFITIGNVVIAIVGVYFLYGLAVNGNNALVYLRNVITPLFCFQVSLIIGHDRGLRSLELFGPLALVILAYGYLELTMGLDFLALFNGDNYLMIGLKEIMQSTDWLESMKEKGRLIRSLEDFLKIELFNSPLFSDLHILGYRLNGPNFHSISYAYALAIFALLLFLRGRVLFGLLALPLLVIIGSKGAVVLVVFVLTALGVERMFGARAAFVTLSLILVAYVATAIVVGLAIGDYHVLGFFGGLDGFKGNPAGHGLGGGGNLNGLVSREQWDRAQIVGQTQVAVESAVGVLLYQMGVAACALFAFNFWLVERAWHFCSRYGGSLLVMSGAGLMTLTANGVVQEEALFSPLAIGFMMILTGLAIGSALRNGGQLGVRRGA